MAVTTQQLNRATLARQLLLQRTEVSATDAVRQVVALQAQEPASVYLGLWNRVAGLDPEAVDDALEGAQLVRATLLRITLHVVHAEDHATVHTAMQPTLRAARLNDRRFTDTGLTSDDADGIMPQVLQWAREGRSNADAEDWLAERGIDEPRLWWALRHYAPLRHAVTGGPWSFGARPQYVAARIPTPTPGDRGEADAALARLVVRYLRGFGPATVADMSQWMLVQRGRLRPVLAELGQDLVRLEGPSGEELLDVADGELPTDDVPAPPRLLPMWDSVLFAHHDRTRVVDDDVRGHVIRRNGDCLPPVLVGGRVVGVWRPLDGGIEVTVWRPVGEDDWAGLEEEAAALRSLLDARDPDPYSRYARWWDRLPDGEVRLLGVSRAGRPGSPARHASGPDRR